MKVSAFMRRYSGQETYISAANLVGRWLERDRRYGEGKHELTPNEERLVRTFRTAEIGDLPKSEQRAASLVLVGWMAPRIVTL